MMPWQPRAARRPCGCWRDPLVFGHLHQAQRRGQSRAERAIAAANDQRAAGPDPGFTMYESVTMRDGAGTVVYTMRRPLW